MQDIDNDDGSGYYHTHDNFLVYGGQGMKNDFGGMSVRTSREWLWLRVDVESRIGNKAK